MDCPAQIEVLVAVIETDGVTVVFTVIKMVFDVAVKGFAHAALEVTTHEIASLLIKDESE